MIEDNVQVCTVLRHFKSDSPYLAFGDEFWIEELNEEDRKQLASDLKHFNNYPYDKHLVARWYYIGRGKSLSVLRDNSLALFGPLFTAMKLFKTGHLLMPLCFYCHRKKWRDMALHGEENYGVGYGLGMGERPYELSAADIQPFQDFKAALAPYLRFLNFGCIPYRKPPKPLQTVDMRCLFATHLFLDTSGQRDNYFLLFDWVLAYTNGLESLYLLQSDRRKADNLAARVAVVLGQDEEDKNRLRDIVTRFYKVRNAIVHGSLLDDAQDEFVQQNIWSYQDILRKSILAFLDLNRTNSSKKMVVRHLCEALSNPSLRRTIRESLGLLKLAK
jgi:hypothetical protein